MKRFAKNISKHEKAQILVIFALMIVGLMGSAALVTDLGTVYFQKTDMQNCADAAALAGAQDLPDNNTAISKAVEFAGRNGLNAIQNGVEKDGDKITVTTPYNGDSTKIEVVCERTVQSSFARVLGFTQSNVSSRAVAQKVGSVGGAAFGYAIFSGNPSYTLNMSGNSNVTGNIHTNYKATMSGNIDVTPEVHGAVEVVSRFDMSGNTHIYGTCQAAEIHQSGNSTITTKIESPAAVVPMYPDFSEIIRSQAEAAGSIYNGNKSISGNTTVTSPIYIHGNLTISGNTTLTFTSPIYVDGNISISGNYSYPGSTIFATGSINISGNNTLSNKVLIYSKNSDITISGNASPAGIIFAPTGTITISGNTINGRVIGDKVSLNGNYDVTSGVDDFECLPPTESSITLAE